MPWTESEAKKLSAVILEKIYNNLKPLNARKILLLCSREFQFFVLDSRLDLLRKFLNIAFMFLLAWRCL
jgi:hypothetical protein